MAYDFKYRPIDPEAYAALMESLQTTGYTSPRKSDKPQKPSRRRGVIEQYGGQGYGFIRPADGGKRLFFHVSNVVNGGQPREGAAVTFASGKDAKGRTAAVDVKIR